MALSANEWEAFKGSAIWLDIESTIQERISLYQEDLCLISNSREKDIELKARIAELDYLLQFPNISINVAREEENEGPGSARTAGRNKAGAEDGTDSEGDF